jgi:hypothetical protein
MPAQPTAYRDRPSPVDADPADTLVDVDQRVYGQGSDPAARQGLAGLIDRRLASGKRPLLVARHERGYP